MESIQIHKNGMITKKEKEFSGSILKFLGHSIKIDETVTLRSFFMMIQRYPKLKNISDILDALLEIASKNTAPGLKTEELKSLLFYKTIEIKGFPGKPSLILYNNLKGVSNEKNIDLKFFHLETLLDHQLNLGNLQHIVFGEKEDVFEYETIYTLFEFIEGIAWELSFNFNPLQCSIRR